MHTQEAWRGEFIAAIVDLAGRDTRASQRLNSLRRRLDWPEGRLMLVVDYLVEAGLVERADWGAGEPEPWQTLGLLAGGARVRLTRKGLDESDDARRGPTAHLPQIWAGGDVIIDSPEAKSTRAFVQGSGAQATWIHQGVDSKQVLEWMEMYRSALLEPVAGGSVHAEHARALLDELRAAVDAEDVNRVNGLGRTLRSIAEGVVGNAAYAVLVTYAKQHLPFDT
jgi:hypothetical protein